ncbi:MULTISPECIES: fimbrial protein [unclassified Serratia (in: enterobacteria)]|uniref:fimbrial protein n=1 Tax=unclassified Serratia (in: enterobacteria) TaxID=2647522 RepID=UPI003076834D
MKKNIIVATLVAAAAMTAASAFAADGTINFTGSVIDQACEVNGGSNTLTVTMGNVAKSALAVPGNTAAATAFTLNVKNCPSTTDGNVQVSFDGKNVDGNTEVLALTNAGTPGVAKGVGIQLYDKSQNKLPLNTASTTYALSNGDATLDFVARYIATNATVEAGSADAAVNFTIIYN